jgi:hypothetical protein
MRTCVAALIAVAGLSPFAGAVQNSRLEFQVSSDNVNWTSSLQVFPGQDVYARAVLTYTGTNPVIGFGSAIFQPTISNWTPTDTLRPFINNGMGYNNSVPSGALSPAQVADLTSFGRISPFAGVNLPTGRSIFGHFHANPTGDGANYLRIAQSQVTSWFGGTGNTSGGSGVNFRQLSEVGRTASDPAFNPATNNVALFKYGVTIDPASAKRQLVFTTPGEWLGNRNSTTGDREIYWYREGIEPSGTERGTPLIVAATVHVVPGPGSAGVLMLIGAGMGRAGRRCRPHLAA